MPTDDAGHGGARPGAGNPGGPTSKNRSEYVQRLTAVEQAIEASQPVVKAPKGTAVMRQFMNYHLWRAGIIQKRVTAVVAAAEAAGAAPVENPQDLADLEYHLEKAADAAAMVAPYESAKLATIKSLGRDDEHDADVSELPDDGLAKLAEYLVPVVANATPGPDSPVTGNGAEHDGRPETPAGPGSG